jgi:hypothetical protein
MIASYCFSQLQASRIADRSHDGCCADATVEGNQDTADPCIGPARVTSFDVLHAGRKGKKPGYRKRMVLMMGVSQQPRVALLA